ncbi:MAG: FKBP-type peptidyl-prolyl cis-trans isomerase [Rikenellaceae bacterium]|nr:FKBP-type peptidyl-prolyl cis-trans isomerase [Rikenellaceae bacterium]
MKKTIIVLTAAILPFLIYSCNGGASVSVKSEADSVAYAIGLDVASSLRNMDTTLNINVVAAGLKDGYQQKSKWEHEQAVGFLREYYNDRVPRRAQEAGEAFLRDIETSNKNIQKTESGLLYEIIEPGDPSFKPTDMRDRVKVTYEGRLKNDKVFDSSYERGDTAEFGLNRVITGWGEGLQLIGKGGKIKLYIPAELAYGPAGQRGSIGPNEPLIFDVELIDVIPYEEPRE